MCPRDQEPDVRKRRSLDVEDLRRWIRRGDLGGSYYVELQMAGEPLLYADLPAVVGALKAAGVAVGLSTNGQLLQQRHLMLAGVDAVTVSVDTDQPARYHELRWPGLWRDLVRGIDALLASRACPPFVDLQLVVPLDASAEAADATCRNLAKRWDDPRVVARWVRDCSAVATGRKVFDVGDDLCVNPWASVSVQSDGTVVSCCYEWGKTPENVYGNLNDQSLVDIWNGPAVAALRAAHRNRAPVGRCCTCYLRSPFLLHLGFIGTWLRRGQVTR